MTIVGWIFIVAGVLGFAVFGGIGYYKYNEAVAAQAKAKENSIKKLGPWASLVQSSSPQQDTEEPANGKTQGIVAAGFAIMALIGVVLLKV